MDAPPIPRLVDLLHAFNGVVVEQFRKRVEKLLSDSIPLWRLLKLLFKILQWRSWVGSSLFWFPLLSFYSNFFVSLVILLSVILWFLFPMESDEGNTPQQQQEEGDADTGVKKKCSSKSHSLFPLSESSKKTQRREDSFAPPPLVTKSKLCCSIKQCLSGNWNQTHPTTFSCKSCKQRDFLISEVRVEPGPPSFLKEGF